jgi:Heterokaryon incompatibility protein (HET)
MDRSEGFYEQVPLSDSQVRLLKLRRDAPDSLLFGDLEIFEFPYKETVPLRRPDYEALSYYWGPKALPGTEPLIYVLAGNNLYPVQIRPNLERALKRLRLTNEDRWLWVDALCIYQKKHNQFATKEKNLQLPIMHEIYNRAKRVCVWLGPEEGQSSSAMKFVRSINTLDDFHQFMKDDSREAEDLANFAQLLRRPWFNRRWIVQEIATARDAQIYCGPEELPWRDFAQAVSLFASRVTDVKRKFRASAKYGHSKRSLVSPNGL